VGHPDVSILVREKSMIVYWMIFFIPAFFALIGNERKKNNLDYYPLNINILWLLLILMLTFFVGLRDRVGGDWGAYLRTYDAISSQENFFDLHIGFLIAGDLGYLFLNWLSAQFNLGIHGVNLICGLIFATGLSLFCRTLPRPLLALTVAMPYLVIVVAMGYSRQAVALGLMLLGFIAFTRKQKFLFFILLILAMAFHKTAIIQAPILALAVTKNRLQNIIYMSILVAIMYFNYLGDSFNDLYRNYIESQDAQSQGAYIRAIMNIFPAIIFLIWPHRFALNAKEKSLWKIISLVSVALFILLLIFPNLSAAIDRIALYMLPIQLVVFSYLPDIFIKKKAISIIIVFLIILYYAFVLFVWLNFGNFSSAWIPYSNLLFIL